MGCGGEGFSSTYWSGQRELDHAPKHIKITQIGLVFSGFFFFGGGFTRVDRG